MSRIITIANPKGGVGKTTTSINLAAGLAIAEKSVLLIDMDPNGVLSSGLGIKQKNIHAGVYELFFGTFDLSKIIISHADLPRLNLVACNVFSHERERRLASITENRMCLKRKLDALNSREREKPDYDFILIDTPPTVDNLTIAALYAADSLLIPLQCGYFAFTVVEKLLQLVKRIQFGANPHLSIEGILLNFYEKNTRASHIALTAAKKRFGDLLFRSVIPKNSAISYAAFQKKPIAMVDALAPGAQAYFSLTGEILENEKKRLLREKKEQFRKQRSASMV